MTEVKAQPMTATERNTLIRITKARFKVLEKGLHARSEQLRKQITDEVMAEHEAAIKKAQARVVKVAAKLERVWDEYKDIVDDEWKNNGLKPKSMWTNAGRPVRSFTDGPGQYLEYSFSPIELHNEVEKRLKEIIGDNPVTQWQLEAEEARILESILVGNLQSGESQKMLDTIPTLESLIPLANGDAQHAIEA